MAKKKPSALDALAKLDDERAALAEREAALRREAALELGTIVLAAGGAVLRPARLKQLIECIVSMGPDEALGRLSAGVTVKPEPRRTSAQGTAEEVRHAAEPEA